MNSQLLDIWFRTGKRNLELKRRHSVKYTGGKREYDEIKIKYSHQRKYAYVSPYTVENIQYIDYTFHSIKNAQLTLLRKMTVFGYKTFEHYLRSAVDLLYICTGYFWRRWNYFTHWVNEKIVYKIWGKKIATKVKRTMTVEVSKHIRHMLCAHLTTEICCLLN